MAELNWLVIVLPKLSDSVFLRQLMRNVSCVCKDILFVELKECIQLSHPVHHMRRFSLLRL